MREYISTGVHACFCLVNICLFMNLYELINGIHLLSYGLSSKIWYLYWKTAWRQCAGDPSELGSSIINVNMYWTKGVHTKEWSRILLVVYLWYQNQSKLHCTTSYDIARLDVAQHHQLSTNQRSTKNWNSAIPCYTSSDCKNQYCWCGAAFLVAYVCHEPYKS